MTYKGKIKGLLVVLAVIVIALGLTFTNSSKGVITIGVISPLTGLVSGADNMGQTFANGIMLAFEEYKAVHPDAVIELIVEDDGFDSKKGLAAFHKLASINKIDGLINLSSPTIDVIKGEVQKINIPVIQLGAETELAVDSVFQIYPDQTAVSLLAEEANRNGVKEIVVVMEQVKAYEKFISDFESAFTGTVTVVRVPVSETDFRSTALQVKELNPSAVLFFASAKVGANVLSRMVDLNVVPEHMYFDLALHYTFGEYKTILGSKLNVLNGAVLLYSVAKTEESFKTKYKERFGTEMGLFSGHGYDAFNVIISTYDQDKEQWIENIQEYKKEGVTGEISFSEIGLRPPEFVIGTVKNGELTIAQ